MCRRIGWLDGMSGRDIQMGDAVAFFLLARIEFIIIEIVAAAVWSALKCFNRAIIYRQIMFE